MTIDTKAIRAAAEAATLIHTDLLVDRYYGGDYSMATLTKAQDNFIATANPATVIALLDMLEAAEAKIKELGQELEFQSLK